MKKFAVTISAMLLLAGCGAGSSDNPEIAAKGRAPDLVANDAAAAMDNASSPTADFVKGGAFEPVLRPSKASEANKLIKPSRYRDALFGYFDDADVMAQLTVQERAEMRADKNAFHGDADLDHDGADETYRTGYFQKSNEPMGLFLAAFEHGRQVGLWTESSPSYGILWISTRDGLILWHCNCPETGTVLFADKRLRVKWSG